MRQKNTVRRLIEELFEQGKSPEEILKAVLAEFPSSRADLDTIKAYRYWYDRDVLGVVDHRKAPGVLQICYVLMLDGWTDDEILPEIKKAHPRSRTSLDNLPSYRSLFRRLDEQVPTNAQVKDWRAAGSVPDPQPMHDLAQTFSEIIRICEAALKEAAPNAQQRQRQVSRRSIRVPRGGVRKYRKPHGRRGTGIGETARRLIREGMTDEEALVATKSAHPESKVSLDHIRWYRVQERRVNSSVLPNREIKLRRNKQA